jgi:predicted RNA-binding Zn ribbon-like protein
MTDMIAGHPALAFLNTVADKGKSRETNSFATADALMDELRGAGLKSDFEPPGTGQLGDLLRLREAAYGVLSAVAASRPPLREDTLFLETAIKTAIADSSLAPDDRVGFLRPGPMGGLFDTMALSIMDFLRSGELDRLKECRGCTRLFLDHGRGPGRRWCSMARCGNRAKVRGFRDRRRAAG